MNRLPYAAIGVLALWVWASAQHQDPCIHFRNLVKKIYNFKPSRLSDDEKKAKGAEMDKVWEAVKADREELPPCLRSALEDPEADPWFRIDGSGLLVDVDPSPDSKAVQAKYWSSADLADMHLQIWVQTLAERGTEGFDVSEGGRRWLEYPKANYFLPIHGMFEVKAFQGALFIFGSMDEAQATPALVRIVNQLDHPGRENALQILMSQATPESLRALKEVDPSRFSETARKSLRALLERPALIRPSSRPRVSRGEFLRVFEGVTKIDWGQVQELEKALEGSEKIPEDVFLPLEPWTDFRELLWGGQPTERDAVAVLKPEDLPLLRKVRRLRIARCNQHAIEDYNDLTKILMTLVWKPELVH